MPPLTAPSTWRVSKIRYQLQAALPGTDLGFGVGRFEEYGNFAAEYATGRPFVLNQPIIAATDPNYMTAIQAGLNRTTPGYGGDQPETMAELRAAWPVGQFPLLKHGDVALFEASIIIEYVDQLLPGGPQLIP